MLEKTAWGGYEGDGYHDDGLKPVRGQMPAGSHQRLGRYTNRADGQDPRRHLPPAKPAADRANESVRCESTRR